MPLMARGVRRLLGVAAVLAVLGMAGLVAWWLSPGIDLGGWAAGPPPRAWSFWQREVETWRQEGLTRAPEFSYVPLADMGTALPLAVLAGEDIAFFDHGAADLRELADALLDWGRGHRLRGASTVSQQLARILFLSPERTVVRKASELRVAWWLDRELGKRRVLELYLNVVEFGPGLLGGGAAAAHFFGKAPSSLTDEEAAGLAAAIPSPSRDNPANATELWRFRRDIILRRMQRAARLRAHLRDALADAASGH
jgi:monofunctional biosynthetic peptidoglycan transglycosylase